MDHLDFFVLHLSAYSTRAYMRQWKEQESKWNAVENEVLIASSAQVRDYTKRLNKSCTTQQARRRIADAGDSGGGTVVVIPYFRGGGIQGEARIPYFEATFWSAWALFGTVVVSICDEKDLEFVSKFPTWKVLKFYEVYDPDTHYHCELLPSATLVRVQKELREKTWKFRYIYYNEADQITLLRAPEPIFKYLDSQYKGTQTHVIIPHRHQAMPVLGDFESALQEKIKVPGAIPFAPYDDIGSVDTEDWISGSCCRKGIEHDADAKRLIFKTAKDRMRHSGSFSFSAMEESDALCTPSTQRAKCPGGFGTMF
jgi:hypothetical protein